MVARANTMLYCSDMGTVGTLSPGVDSGGVTLGVDASGVASGVDASGVASGVDASGVASGVDASGVASGVDASGVTTGVVAAVDSSGFAGVHAVEKSIKTASKRATMPFIFFIFVSSFLELSCVRNETM